MRQRSVQVSTVKPYTAHEERSVAERPAPALTAVPTAACAVQRVSFVTSTNCVQT